MMFGRFAVAVSRVSTRGRSALFGCCGDITAACQVRLASTEAEDIELAAGLVSDEDVESPPRAGARLLSVTNVIGILDKPGLLPWAVHSALRKVGKDLGSFKGQVTGANLEEILSAAKEEPDRIKNAAAGLGTAAHDTIDAIIRAGCFADAKPRLSDALAIADSKLKDAPTPSKNAVRSFLDWAPRSGLRLDCGGDTMLVWPELGLRGAFDALGWTTDGRAVIIDFKTSSRVHDTFALQLAAYAHLFSNARAVAQNAATTAPADNHASIQGLESTVIASSGVASVDWGGGIVTPVTLAAPDDASGPVAIASLVPGSEEWLQNIAKPGSIELDTSFVDSLLDRTCGEILSFREEEDTDPVTRHARAAMMLRPATSVHSAVVRLGKYSSLVSEVKVTPDLRGCWNGFKSALYLRRLTGDDESQDAMLTPSRPAGTEANSILNPVVG
jgi:hypothetical protein